MAWKRSQEGYLLIDHTESPGLTAEDIAAVAHKGMPLAVPGGVKYESATVTCAHCQTVVIINPQRTRERHYCAKCDRYVCDRAECILFCRPFEKLADTIQNLAVKGLLL